MDTDIIVSPTTELAQQVFNEDGTLIDTVKVLAVNKQTPDFDFRTALARVAQIIKASDAVKHI